METGDEQETGEQEEKGEADGWGRVVEAIKGKREEVERQENKK